MTTHDPVFLSYSRNDRDVAVNLCGQLARHGLSVFRDDESIRAGDLWLNRLQDAVDACGSFIVLVGRDGVGRWIGAETQAALNRYFGTHDDATRVAIFPILLGETGPESLPAFLRLFQATPWNGADPLPETLFEQIRKRVTAPSAAVAFEGCPFVGLAAYRMDQAQLFFGRQKETLDALACFDTRPGFPAVRWLEINGNSGCGKSSLMQAGLLPLVKQGWLWPRTGHEHWRLIGPMMPGEHPVEMLAESLTNAFRDGERTLEMADVRKRLEVDDNRALADWLRGRKEDGTALLLAVDQFEELFTFADLDERRRLDRLLATALEDPDCPLFIISTVRADFFDRFAEDLPRLVEVQNRKGRAWKLAPIGADGLREVIDGPARLASLDVGQVQEAMVAEARDEPGALPLVENALHWLWEKRTGNRLSGKLFTEQGGLAGILSHSADGLLAGLDAHERERALELLFRLVQVDPEGRRHTRRRIPLAEAVDVAGGGKRGRALVNRLAGVRARDGGKAEGPLRLITVTEEEENGDVAPSKGRWVNLIHETLIRSKSLDAAGVPKPYWFTLWDYIEKHKQRAAWIDRLKADTQIWIDNDKRASDLWSHERVREAVAALAQIGPEVVLTDAERGFLGPIKPQAMIAELDKPETAHKRRLLIGERLAILGDPRSGVGVDAEGTSRIDWRAVPGGEVAIQVERRLIGGTKARHKTVETFHIARYPTTVAQYRCFINAKDGWHDRRWWDEDLHRDADGNTYEFGRFGNHPAVYVSWFDAVAFCRWLSRRLGFTVRLPDEWEWQQAATGGNPARKYPWAPDWDPAQEPWRANTFESRLGQPTAVGMYPAGATPADILDMAGTVWEWCLNKYDKPEVTQSRDDDFDSRVLRGGSWNVNQDYARSAYRLRDDPSSRVNDIGFRVVCSSPSSGTEP